MMKLKFNIRLFIFSIVILALALFAVFYKSGVFFTEPEPIYIAVVGSLNESFREEGMALQRGVQLYVDSVNQAGGVNGKPIELIMYDDQGDEEKAKQIALQIAEEKKALVVLGHTFSNGCIKGGEVYKAAKIPAITPLCVADQVTEGNDWYFGVLPNNRLNGVFLANYAKTIMKHKTVSIIYDDQDKSSLSLAENFEESFVGLKGQVKNKWIINTKADNVEEQIENVGTELLRVREQPDIILIPLQSAEAKKVIVSIKRKGLQYPILATLWGANFKEYPEEQAQPGFFSDGIYDKAALLFDIGGEKVQRGRSQYVETYHEMPIWAAATAYEAAYVAIMAMIETGVQGKPEALTEERQQIRDYLARLTSMEKGIDGVDGRFYFDKHGNAVKPLAIGVFKKQQFISALTQFKLVPDVNRIAGLEKELAAGRIMTIGGQYMYKTNIVYTGIEFNEIRNIDDKNSQYEADFYLWFRYKRGVDATNIEFTNSIRDGFKQLQLEEPIVENLLPNDVIYRAYHVKGDFNEKFNFRDYPFDTQKLTVKFRHANLTRNNLIYVVDHVGMGETTTKGFLNKLKQNNVLSLITDWEVEAANLFQDTVTSKTTLGDPKFFGTDSNLEYSRFNAVIEIKRDIISFITKNLLPLLFLMVISYIMMFWPFEEISLEAVSATLVAVAFFHLSLANGLPDGIGYAVALDYAFYMIYGLIIFQLLLLLLSQRQRLKQNEVALKQIVLTGKIVYPLVFFITVISMGYIYGDINLSHLLQSAQTSKQEAAQKPAESISDDGQVVLTFGAWRTVEVEKVNRFLADFTAKHPNIRVKFQSVVVPWYTATLQFQLEHHIAADVFYLRPFSRSRYLFEAGYLEPLGGLPGLTENFDLHSRQAWLSERGDPYAVPFRAVSYGIYYNIDIFKQLNLKLPSSWAELLTTAQTLKEAGIIPFANGIETGWATSELIFMNLAPNFIGGREGRLKYEQGQRCFNDADVVAAFQAVADMAPYLPPTPETVNYDESKQLFEQGRAAMFLGSSTEISDFESDELDFKWNVFAIPAPAGQPEYMVYAGDFGIGLNAASKHKEAAKRFLEWLTKPETGELFSNELPGFFAMHQKAPDIRNQHAKAFLALTDERETDVLWVFPKMMEGIPNGKALIQKSTAAVIKGENTPTEAAEALQDGLAQWFKPAQKCLLQTSRQK
jgi:branched-chain amino acid transport system substrate-binding protein